MCDEKKIHNEISHKSKPIALKSLLEYNFWYYLKNLTQKWIEFYSVSFLKIIWNHSEKESWSWHDTYIAQGKHGNQKIYKCKCGWHGKAACILLLKIVF